jgi:hypothetical protein
MVVTYKPNEASRIYTVDTSQLDLQDTEAPRNTFAEPRLVTGAPLIFSPGLPLSAAPAPFFRSGWVDPTDSANSGRLVSPISSIQRDQGNQRTAQEEPRIKPRYRKLKTRGDELWTAAFENAFPSRIKGESEKPGFTGILREMINITRREEQLLNEGLKGIDMKTVSLESSPVQSARMILEKEMSVLMVRRGVGCPLFNNRKRRR